jgi:glycogen debranching enzyme
LTPILIHGSAFCVSDDRGDVDGGVSGFYADDTRHLDRFVLTVDGERPRLLASRRLDHSSAVAYFRCLPGDALVVDRTRVVDGTFDERIGVESQTSQPLAFEVAVALGADFADVITVKEHELTDVPPVAGHPLPRPAAAAVDDGALLFADGAFRTRVLFSHAPELDGAVATWRVELPPRGRWEVQLRVLPEPAVAQGRRVRDVEWLEGAPSLRSAWAPLEQAFACAVRDLGALRLESGVPAAGAPWFMTVFGRDSLIASLQTLVLGPELATATLAELARLQATADDPSIDAEPGKIVHEVRGGRAAGAWFPRYYGSIDATPLFLVLCSEVWRWTGDRSLVERFREPALAALEWIDEYGDRDGDGFVEYERRSARGLPNQSWKDSWDSQRFRDGRFASPPLAPCEVQGYVHDAKHRLAELAREAWDDSALAARLEREAEELRRRFDAAFWVEEAGFYALALDGDKRQVDSLCSNVGQLLWSGIVPSERLDAVVAALFGDELWSGWGIRTMSRRAAAYNAIGYHTGTVWPHDCSLIAQGLARYGRDDEAHRLARALVEAAEQFDDELPEAFAGIARSEAPFPVPYPVSARPQAWAAGAAVLAGQVLLGLVPDPRERALTTRGAAPDWLGPTTLTGIRAFGRSWDVRVEGGAVSVS